MRDDWCNISTEDFSHRQAAKLKNKTIWDYIMKQEFNEYSRIDCKRVRFYTQANRFRSHDGIVIRIDSDHMTVYSSQ